MVRLLEGRVAIYTLGNFSVDTWIFYTLDYHPIFLYLFCSSDCSSDGLWELLQLAPVFL